MAKRICDICGKNKDMESGKTCENGHFVCRGCRKIGVFDSGITKCPICKTKLR